MAVRRAGQPSWRACRVPAAALWPASLRWRSCEKQSLWMGEPAKADPGISVIDPISMIRVAGRQCRRIVVHCVCRRQMLSVVEASKPFAGSACEKTPCRRRHWRRLFGSGPLTIPAFEGEMRSAALRLSYPGCAVIRAIFLPSAPVAGSRRRPTFLMDGPLTPSMRTAREILLGSRPTRTFQLRDVRGAMKRP